MDPHGFIAKIQGIQIKSRLPANVEEELAFVLLRRARHRSTMLAGMSRALAGASSEVRTSRILGLDGVVTDEQLKTLIEASGLTEQDRELLKELSARVGAFAQPVFPEADDEDIPF